MDTFVSWLSAHMMPCLYKQLFGISCPACGGQRGLLLLLQGDVSEAICIFPPFAVWGISLVVFFVLYVLHSLKPAYVRILLWMDFVALILNMVYQNFIG